MLGRLIKGLILGALVGGGLGAALVFGLHITFASNFLLPYLAAAITGAATGLLAGKPIWSSDGKIEAGLKAGVGALLGAFMVFAIRRWLNFDVSLEALRLGSGPVGDLPMVALPAIGAALGGFYEVDNTPLGDASDAKSGDAAPAKRSRVTADEELADEEVDEPVAAKKKKR